MVFPSIATCLDRSIEPIACLFDLHTNLWHVGQFKRCTIFFYQVFQWNAVKKQITLIYIKPFLWEVESLID